MLSQDNYALAKFGIDEIYIHKGLTADLLEKLRQRAHFSLDAENSIVLKHASHDMVFIFHHRDPSRDLIHRFLKFLHQDVNRENFIEEHTLLNEEELFGAVKSKKFVLVTARILLKELME